MSDPREFLTLAERAWYAQGFPLSKALSLLARERAKLWEIEQLLRADENFSTSFDLAQVRRDAYEAVLKDGTYDPMEIQKR